MTLDVVLSVDIVVVGVVMDVKWTRLLRENRLLPSPSISWRLPHVERSRLHPERCKSSPHDDSSFALQC